MNNLLKRRPFPHVGWIRPVVVIHQTQIPYCVVDYEPMVLIHPTDV